MQPNYWLDLFTGKTWDEFKAHGGNLSGFRLRRRRMAEQIKPGDYLICYLTGLSRFIAVLEVKSPCFEDNSTIWIDESFPLRFKVAIKHELTAKTAIPITELKDRLSIFRNLSSPHAWTGFFRGSPHRFTPEDGQVIVDAISHAITHPVDRDFDQSKYFRRPYICKSDRIGMVSIPEDEPQLFAPPAEPSRLEPDQITHTEIQGMLLQLGSDMGLDVWVARNDRNRSFNNIPFTEIKNLRTDLPRQFDEATTRTIEMIDVLWLQGETIVAAFEVEHTTSIYSGLLRMADLISMQPNIKINLYLVAPDERWDKVNAEINRPTFRKLKPSLPSICKFIAYSKLKSELTTLGPRIRYLKPDFIDQVAITCKPDET
jgi:hypothetical protein